ncbi:nucleotidyltransferase family protein [Sulfurimonas hydrogeniphila]|uniref:nucleotidyltransferase family protein n=1 Tax=Sulfurimonas TaxID=202746 RepID=UPI00125EBEF1|nr:nucleotidyltransferase domain-containing protein [Sulfurimonas hydrogeniphila]
MKATKNNIIEYLKQIKPELYKNGISSVALFGSFAKETQTVYSDIDIAISKDENFLQTNTSYDYFDTVATIKSKIRKQFHRNIDIFDLDSNSPFKESIKKELIYV